MRKFDYRHNRVEHGGRGRLSRKLKRFHQNFISYDVTKRREQDFYDGQFYWYKSGECGSLEHEEVYLHCEDIEINYKCHRMTGVRSE
jgi:hypothetical protein